MAEKAQSVADVKEMLGQVFSAEKAEGVDAVFQFDLTGDNGDKFWIHVHDGAFDSGDGEHDAPTLTLNAAADDFIKVVNGEMAAMNAFMMGKLKVKGDMGLAMKFQQIFPTS